MSDVITPVSTCVGVQLCCELNTFPIEAEDKELAFTRYKCEPVKTINSW